MDHYKFLSRALGALGYNGTYFPKPDSPCIYIKDNNGPDGCAIFYRKDMFELIRVETRIVEVWRVQSNQVNTFLTRNAPRDTFSLSGERLTPIMQLFFWTPRW